MAKNWENESSILQFLAAQRSISVNAEFVIPAGIAGIQAPWMARPDYIPVFWIPAIPAGMTVVQQHLYNQEARLHSCTLDAGISIANVALVATFPIGMTA